MEVTVFPSTRNASAVWAYRIRTEKLNRARQQGVLVVAETPLRYRRGSEWAFGELVHLVTLWKSTKEQIRLYEESSYWIAPLRTSM